MRVEPGVTVAGPPSDSRREPAQGPATAHAQKGDRPYTGTTHDDPDRTAMVVDIARRLKNALGKEVHVNEVVQQALSGNFDADQTRLIDLMLDERLPDALEAITTGRMDPVALNQQDALGYWGW